MTMGDVIVVMKDGLVQQMDSPLELYEKPANQFVAGFIGSPAMNFVPAKLRESAGKVEVEADGFRVEMPQDLISHVREWVGRDVIFGIRPEDIADRALTGDANPAWTIRTLVDVHEPLGSDVILYLTAGSHSIVARVDAHSQAKMGQTIDVVLNMRKMHLFNATTQEAIL